VTEVKRSAELSTPSFLIRREGDVLRVEINKEVQADGDQIVRDVKAQLHSLINSGQLPGGKLLKINGRSTVLASYVIALELAHRYSAIAVFDPKIGDRGLDRYIITISHTPEYQVGDRIDLERDPCQTVKVVLCGAPNTGKTVFRDGLKQAILEREDAPQDFYTISGCPDGDGSWFTPTAQKYPELAAELKKDYKAKFTREFAQDKARTVEVIKNSLLLFDVGGKISEENELIMPKATHAVILAKSESEVADWQGFCRKLNLSVIAIIYSDIDATTDEIETKSPQLKGTVHRLIRGELVSNRPMIQELAKQLVKLASLS
jgi:CRISPR-associated protein Csx3